MNRGDIDNGAGFGAVLTTMQLICFGNPSEELPPKGSYTDGVMFPSTPDELGVQYRVSTEFEVVEGRRMPLWLELESVSRDVKELAEPTWFARVELLNGTPKMVNFGFDSSDGEREVKWSDFQRQRSTIYIFYTALVSELGVDGEAVRPLDHESHRRVAEFIEQRRTGRRRLKTDDYKYAAQVYRDNFDGAPTQAVADAFDVGIRRAGDIVAQCRKRGFLSKTTKQGKKKI